MSKTVGLWARGEGSGKIGAPLALRRMGDHDHVEASGGDMLRVAAIAPACQPHVCPPETVSMAVCSNGVGQIIGAMRHKYEEAFCEGTVRAT
jgi:hypothetical protein